MFSLNSLWWRDKKRERKMDKGNKKRNDKNFALRSEDESSLERKGKKETRHNTNVSA